MGWAGDGVEESYTHALQNIETVVKILSLVKGQYHQTKPKCIITAQTGFLSL